MFAFVEDLRFAFRLLSSARRETFLSVTILALGIGANTAMFSAVNHVLWRPFPFRDEARLVRLREMVTAADGTDHPFNMSSAAILALRDSARVVFEQVVAMSGQDMALSGADGPERVTVVLQTEGFEDTLAVQPVIGRPFSSNEAQRGIDAAVALVSHAAWETRFGRSAAVLGSIVRLNDRPFTIVGVMPPQYAFPYDAQFWVPWRLDAADRNRDFAVWARTRPGVAMPQVRDAMRRVADRIRRERADLPAGYGMEVRTIRENLLGDQERPLLAVTALVFFMLLVAAANVATLLLARAVSRSREFAVRAALGQTRARLVSQLVAESLALASIGCAAGLLLAAWLSPLTAWFVPRVLGGQLGLAAPQTDWRVALFAVAVSLATALAAGIVPAIATFGTPPQAALAGERAATTGRANRSLLGILIVAETALTLVLLAGAGDIIRGFIGLRKQPLGFEARGLLAIELTPPPAAYADASRRTELVRRLVEEVSASPGVLRSAITTVNPLGGSTWGATIVSHEMTARDPQAVLNVNHRLITPGLLETMGTPILRGRGFTAQDRAGTQPVTIVSNLLARRLWPNAEAVGRRVRLARTGSPWLTVVGVAGDVSDAHDPGVPQETWYVPYAQHAATAAAQHLYIMVRSGARPLDLVPDVRRAIARVDRTLAPYAPVAMDAYRIESISRERASAGFMLAFGAFGLLLAALGVYGIMSLSVAQRTVEFGIRMALGARAGDILPLVLRRALALVAPASRSARSPRSLSLALPRARCRGSRHRRGHGGDCRRPDVDDGLRGVFGADAIGDAHRSAERAQAPMTDVLLLAADRLVRAPLRAQLIEEGFEVVATDTWPSMRRHLRPGDKPRLAIVDLHDLDNPAQVLDGLRLLLKPARVVVISAAGTLSRDELARSGFVVVARPASIDEVVRVVRGALARGRAMR